MFTAKDNTEGTPDTQKKRRHYSTAAGLIIVVSLMLICHDVLKCNTSPEAIRDMVISWGPWGGAGYLVMFTVVPLTLFPDAILAVASGMAFGMAKGFILTWLGALLGGSLAFVLARWIGKEAMEKLLKKLGHKERPVPVMKGFGCVLLLRLIPLVPFDVVSYGAGLSSVSYRNFISATAIGIIPGVFVYVNVGDKLLCANPTYMYAAMAMLVALTVVSVVGVRHLKSKAAANGEDA